MVEPVTLTATAIVSLALTQFVKSGSGELAKQLTDATITNIKRLRQKIWTKLRDQPNAAEFQAEIEQNSQATPEQIQQIAIRLDIAMDQDSQFAVEVKQLASEIHQEINVDQGLGQNVQNVYGGQACQVNDSKAPTIQAMSGGTININHNY